MKNRGDEINEQEGTNLYEEYYSHIKDKVSRRMESRRKNKKFKKAY